MSELWRTPRTQRFRSRFTVALVVGVLSGLVAVGALAGVRFAEGVVVKEPLLRTTLLKHVR
jgi:hypothetical protein